MLTLIGGLLALTGYTFTWAGVLMVRGYTGPGRPQGPGILDLILPSRLPNLQAALDAGPTGASPLNSATSTVGGVTGKVGTPNPIDPSTGRAIPDNPNAATPGPGSPGHPRTTG